MASAGPAFCLSSREDKLTTLCLAEAIELVCVSDKRRDPALSWLKSALTLTHLFRCEFAKAHTECGLRIVHTVRIVSALPPNPLRAVQVITD